jgi:hypothetical protein
VKGEFTVAELKWDEASIADLLHSIDGPVGRWLVRKTTEMTSAAMTGAPIQKPKNWSWGRNSTSYMPRSMGYLKGSIRPHMGYSKGGNLFAGTDAAYGPTLFLERPADQMHERIPFMSNALYAAMAD